MTDTSSTSPAELVEAARAVRPLSASWSLGIEESGSAASLASGIANLAAQNAPLNPLADGFAAWAFQRRPLRKEQAAVASTREGLPAACRELAALLAPMLSAPQETEAMDRLLDAGEAALSARHLLPRLRDPEQALGWLAMAWGRLLRMGSADLPLSLLEATTMPDSLEPLRVRLRAEWAALYLPPEEALAEVRKVCAERFGLWREYMASELLLRMGDEEGEKRLISLWRTLAWHPQLTLKLHALLHPTPVSTSAMSDVAVLLYSWNKADLLGATLENLLETDLGEAKVFFLDNGSTDHMQETVARLAPRFGEGRFHSLRLPVNVGAPAARNWLLSLSEVRGMRWATFLDDDVELPANWLRKLLSTAEHCERKGEKVDVVGCMVTSAGAPRTVQSADYHLLPPNESTKTFENYLEKIMVFENCANDFDLGLFSYDRPATSVSGCCHLLSMEGVDATGGFDIRFSPTQFDDLERDLRTGVGGRNVHYAGTLAIHHIQHSSLARAQSLSSIGHIFGNKIKLEGKYELEEIRSLQARISKRLEADLKEKEEELLKTLG